MTDAEFAVWLAEMAKYEAEQPTNKDDRNSKQNDEAANEIDEPEVAENEAEDQDDTRLQQSETPPADPLTSHFKRLKISDIFTVDSAEKEESAKDVSLLRASSPSRKRKTTRRKAEPELVSMPIDLLETQHDHLKRLQDIHSRFPFALDFSMLGAGKTYTSAKLAQLKGYKHVIVVCPVSVIPKWKYMRATYGIPVKQIFSFQSLRTNKFMQPKHGLLYRRDFKHEMQVPHPWRVNIMETQIVDKVEFTPTEDYLKMIEEGTLLIMDEIQNIKNISSQFLAAQAMIHAITLRNGKLKDVCFPKKEGLFPTADGETPEPFKSFPSHVLLLSGSPMDKQQHAIHMFRALGVMTEDRVAQQNIQTGLQDWRGMQEIYDFCYKLDPKATVAVPPRAYYEAFDSYVYRLFQAVFKKHCSSFMLPPKVDTELRKRNAYYGIDKEGADILRRGLQSLVSVSRFNGTTVDLTGGPGAAGAAMGGISRALQIIETGKIKLFARIALEKLATEPKSKVVIAVNYTDTVTDLVTLLAQYKPLTLTGSTTEANRGKIMNQFQRADDEHRVLICNQSVASTGIDLDDKHGDFPRLCLVSPNYSTITSYQLGHRFQRADSKSDADVHFVYAKYKNKRKEDSCDILEIRVLDALSRKSQVMKETTGEQVDAGVVFPGDHMEWDEDIGDLGKIHTIASKGAVKRVLRR